MTMRIRESKFYDRPATNHYRNAPDYEQGSKMLAKMLREITHEKPPRGRIGRLLPQDERICVETRVSMSGSYPYHTLKQGVFTFESELAFIESNKKTPRNRYFGPPAKPYDNEEDITTLLRLHIEFQNKENVTHTMNTLNDLVTGLMGLGLKKAEVEKEESWRVGNGYVAKMYLDNFEISIREVK